MAEITTTVTQTLEALLDSKKYGTLKDILVTLNGADIAALLSELPHNRISLLFRLLPKELAAETFVEMEPDVQEDLIRSFSDSELKEIVDELYMDDAVDLVEEMPSNVVKRILAQAEPETRRLINEMLKYPEDSAGSIMTTEYVELRPDMTTEDAIKHIRRTGIDKETVNVCYITDERRRLIGAVSIRSLILAPEDNTMDQIMEPNVISVTTQEDQESVAECFAKYDFTALPVVDGEGRLVGIVTVDDAIDVLTDEATEDMEKMAAITPSDKPYLKLSVWSIFKSRIPWLLLLMVSATFTGSILTHFEGALASCIVLVSFVPMLMDTGGNSGGQASVTIIRGLSLHEIEFSDIFRVIWKEVRVAVLCGVALAVVNFAKLMLINHVGFSVSLVVCLTLVATVFTAKVVGCTLPILAKKIGFDPAVMASPFITTIVDALSLLIYFAFARMLLGL
ncbi:MAG: magnesium transporter [Oscillospiraceae bacterium]|nr:magnesium transporter [Oscillospiraceae bacterium]